jgi:hypothetical protein
MGVEALSEKWVHSILMDLPLMGSSNFKPVLGIFIINKIGGFNEGMAMNLDFVEKKFEILFFVLVLFCCEEP